MKLKLIILSILCLTFCSINAQDKEDNGLDSYRIAFITDRLDLSSKEAQVFWPIYNKHSKLYNELKERTWEPIKKRLKNIDNLSDAEAEKLLADYRNYKKTRLQYRESFINELLSVLSPKKIMQLKKADYDFNKELLRQYQASN